jgi:hypothetical protein
MPYWLAGFLWMALLWTPAAWPAACNPVRLAVYDTGIDDHPVARLLTAAYAAAGVGLEQVEVPLARALLEADRGHLVDADPGRVREAISGFHNLVLVPEPVHRLQLAAFVRGDGPEVTGWDSLRQHRVIAFGGSISLDRALTRHGIKDVYRAEGPPGAALMLLIGRGEVAILPLVETRAFLAKYDTAVLRPSGPLLIDEPLYHVLNKRCAHLVDPLARALRRLRTAP